MSALNSFGVREIRWKTRTNDRLKKFSSRKRISIVVLLLQKQQFIYKLFNGASSRIGNTEGYYNLVILGLDNFIVLQFHDLCS